MDTFNLILVAILLALTAFFVASEFAIVKIRSTRIDQLVAEGNLNAIAAKKVIANLDEYLSACQLGITVTALGLGWLGKPAIESLLRPLLEYVNLSDSVLTIASFIIAFTAVTFLHVVFGELAPKTLAIQKAEMVTLIFARPLIVFYKIMFPFIKTLNVSARLLTSLFGLKRVSEHETAHSEDELRMILSESYKSGEINLAEYKYVNNIFQFDNRIAKEIMVPRTEFIAIDKADSIRECIDLATIENYTRYPVTDGDKDNIIGLVNMKDVFTDYVKGIDVEDSIEVYIRPIIQAIESTPVNNLLLRMQRERVHMAILLDEYGGTAGLVTVEDILEEIVGEIRDEYDEDEVPEIKKINEYKTVVEGKVLLGEINNLFGLNIDDRDVDTIGGWVLAEKIDAKQGDILKIDNYQLKILDMEGYHIKYLEILRGVKQDSIA
ncbi:hemolysin family protein [Litchfieldia salsa]|uniref:Hemolysin, contains CBS domains n=1 Tax=Litchfieldia salsa TaxID=930152 RepID=A0A1H0VJU2_9BACI|nr:hemolysin family protein [Litchfieldia salsa]SDP78777.1 Hemolysin, contains CBS domains [Litchfieldia salsa]